MTAQPSSPIDISPTLKMYMEFIELSKRNYENFLKSAPLRADGMDGKKAEAESITSAYDAALLNWQKSGEEVFKRFVQNQMELCDLFGHRWEQHLKLPERRLSQCRSEQLTDSVTKATDAWMGAMPRPMAAGFKDVQARAMDIAMEFSDLAFTFAGKISNAQTFQDIVTLQTEFAQDRMQAFATQTQELCKLIGETVQKLQRG